MKKNYLLLSLLFLTQWSQAQIVNIPDATFKNYLLNTIVVDTDTDFFADSSIDINNDGEIQESEALLMTGMNLNYLSITSLEGIQYFTNLVSLSCNEHRISTLDLSQNVNLENLYLFGNGHHLTSLDISQCINLKKLDVSANYSFANLDVTQNVNLEELDFSSCDITQIDVTQNPNLDRLDCSRNTLISLDVSQNTNLTDLDCCFSSLPSLDVTQNVNLIKLDAYGNQINTINLTNNTSLTNLRIGANNIAVTDLSQNVNIRSLDCSGNSFTSIDLSNNVSLQSLTMHDTQLPTIDVSQNINLKKLYCDDGAFTSLDVSQNVNLEILELRYNSLTNIDLSTNEKLTQVNFSDNLLTTLDVSQNPLLKKVTCFYNQLEYINVKNGINSSPSEFRYWGNPNLEGICADDGEVVFLSTSPYLSADTVVGTYCSFTPGGDYVTLQGTTRLDTNTNGCDINDTMFPNMEFGITHNGTTETMIANSSGNYEIHLADDDDPYTITPQLENPTYFTVSPTSLTINTSTASNPTLQDFCITPNGTYNDVEVTIIPVEVARPGFDAPYQIIYKNKGNTIRSGTIQLTFDDDLMDLVSASPMEDTQAVNTLTWNYTNLAPQESRNITFTMNINTPTDIPAVNGDDVLSYEVMITPTTDDEAPDDNLMTLQQTVVNSFDPNDIRCLEGETVTTDYIDKYVHYIIRFENTGTASAVNVVVTDYIDDTMFDISTLIPTASSHRMETRIKEDNSVEFIFENINLPFDDASNDGYVVFKIKTLPTLQENDTFDNNAAIYFDFNAPIITNTATTLIMNPLSVSEENLETATITLYPNPVKEQIQITSNEPIEKLELRSIDGRRITVKEIQTTRFSSTVNVSSLPSGIYIMNITTTKGKAIKKIIKQ
ncbi:DUF7619 domain-containing protein [Kordia sp.]|uniref:DUF7619 domain-containing protein n=1 Tax=Kordia sp. TaxID=1965332 RepID=UPI003D2A9123